MFTTLTAETFLLPSREFCLPLKAAQGADDERFSFGQKLNHVSTRSTACLPIIPKGLLGRLPLTIAVDLPRALLAVRDAMPIDEHFAVKKYRQRGHPLQEQLDILKVGAKPNAV
jgi:hypothetical protein